MYWLRSYIIFIFMGFNSKTKFSLGLLSFFRLFHHTPAPQCIMFIIIRHMLLHLASTPPLVKCVFFFFTFLINCKPVPLSNIVP